MKFLLDSSTCVAHLRGRSPRVTSGIRSNREQIAISSIVVLELRAGAYRAPNPEQEMRHVEVLVAGFPSLPFGDDAEAARLKCHLAASGTPIGPYDLLIAATALVHRLTIVTSNVREFARVPGLTVVDWNAA